MALWLTARAQYVTNSILLAKYWVNEPLFAGLQGFAGGLVVDYPHSTRAKKYFLVLMVGQPAEPMHLQGLTGEEVVMEVNGWPS